MWVGDSGLVAAISIAAALRVREGLRALLVKRGWLDGSDDTGSVQSVALDGRPPEQTELIVAWVRAEGAVDFAQRGDRTEAGRMLDNATREVAEAAGLIAHAYQALAQYPNCAEPFMDSDDIHNVKAKIQAVAVLRDYAARVAAFVACHRGVPRIADRNDFNEFTGELTVLLQKYELIDRDIAEIIYGSRSDQAVHAVREKRRRYKEKKDSR